MYLKRNVNKIHSDLLVTFNEVKIEEKSSITLGEYIELSVVNESKELIALVKKQDLDSNRFSWNYYSNPNTKDYLVERSSTVDGFIEDVRDIFQKNRFDSDYVNTLQ